MCEKLYTLCQLQLGSIVTDLEHSVSGVNAAAARIMQCFDAHRSVVGKESAAAREHVTVQDTSLAGTVGSELNNIIMGLQFHDELNQRLQHLQTLLQLLEEQPAATEQPFDSEKMLARLTRIFSSSAEFRQLKKVFPGCHEAGATEAIELF